jgi:hypothetical protein
VFIIWRSSPKTGPPPDALRVWKRRRPAARQLLFRGGQDLMQNRRKFLLMLTTGVVAMGLVVASVIADELIGVITKVDVEGKKITVIDEKDNDKETELKITDDTKEMRKGEEVAVDLEKLAKSVDFAKEKGKKGASAKIYYEKGVATKIERKKGVGKKKVEKAD